MMDLFFLFTGAVAVLVGTLFVDQSNLRIVIFVVLAFYFIMLFLM